MNHPVIEVKNIGKKYKITHERGRYITLRDVMVNILKRPFSFIKAKTKAIAGFEKKEEFWALRDINFTVGKGEVIGIIGKNGAGKSTLLKILSQITPPSEGEIKLRGRIGSLLEVGTGFHPELTGRENIFLNGAILGMTRKEMAKKFDEIVEFAGIAKFLDTPVKYYSSGMYVRLAFSVAAHMEPDILLVDEVLAVGDADFQKKCLGKMEEITKNDGRTILFVSHNMAAISDICKRTILISEGKIVKDGPTYEVIDTYLNSGEILKPKKEWIDNDKKPGNEIVRLDRVIIKQDGQVAYSVDIRKPVDIEMEYELKESTSDLSPHFHIYNKEGICVFIVADNSKEWISKDKHPGKYTSIVHIPGNFLSEGTLFVTPAMSSMKPFRVHFEERDAVAFHVIDSFDGDSARGSYSGKIPGVIRPILEWKTKIQKII